MHFSRAVKYFQLQLSRPIPDMMSYFASNSILPIFPHLQTFEFVLARVLPEV